MEEIIEILESFLPIIFYTAGIVALLLTAGIKIVQIIKKKLSGESVETDLEELEEEISAILTKKFLKTTSKSGVTVDESVVTDVIATSTKTLIENYSNQSENTEKE